MRILSLLCALVFVWTMAGCSDDDTLPNLSSSTSSSTSASASTSTSTSSSAAAIAPRDLVSYDVNNLIDNGTAILDAVAASYSEIGDDDLVGTAACAADFAIYPDDLADEATFSTRMARVYHAPNGILEAWKRDQVIENYDPSTAVIDESAAAPAMNKAGQHRFFKKLWKAAKKVVKKNFGSLIRMVPGVGPFLGSAYDTLKNLKSDVTDIASQLGLAPEVARQVQLVQAAGGFNLAPINAALDKIDQKLDVFGKEMRLGFADVNTKLGTVLDNLVSLRGDVNILLNNDSRILYGLSSIQSGLANLQTFVGTALAQAGMDEAIRNHRAFMKAYAEKSDYTIASNFVWQNTQVSYQGQVNIETFVDCALSIQAAAKASTELTNSTMYDPALGSTVANPKPWKCRVGIQYWLDYDHYLVESADDMCAAVSFGNLDYANPKKAVPMSLGNLEYLIQMMNDQMRMNNVIFSGDNLKRENSAKATTYLNILNTKIKPQLIQAIKTFKAKTAFYLDCINNASWEWVRPVAANGCMYWLVRLFEENYYTSWMDITYHELTTTDAANRVSAAADFYFNDYLGLYLSKLMAYEVRLRAYL